MSTRTLALIGIVVAVAAVTAYAHVVLGYVCPLPWPDESHFLWQSISLLEHGTVQAAELNPERTIYWMPPGYMVIMAGVLGVFGKTLAVARWFSFLCVLSSLAIFLNILRRLDFSVVSLLIAGWFFCDAYFVACGNIGRMEAVILLISMIVLALVVENRVWPALGISAITPLIHPNGFYLLASVGLCLAVRWWRTRVRPKLGRTAIMSVAAAIVGWILYALWVARDWASYQSDMKFQMVRKFERKVLGLVPTWDNLALLVLLLMATIACPKEKRGRLSLLWIAGALWWMHILGFEMWYYLFLVMAALIVSLLAVESVRDQLARFGDRIKPALQWTLVGLFVVVVCGWHVYRGNLESPVGYPYNMKFFECSTPDGTPYLTDDDRANVATIIRAESGSRPITVQFFPRAEALLYLDLRSNRVAFSDPLFCARKADLYIFHESKYLPQR